MRRRTFVGAGLGAAAAVTAVTVPSWRNNGPWRFFTADEAATVDAICEQFIPADRDAGAREAGVVNYIDIQLTRPFRKHRRTYREGIATVDERSRARFKKRFTELAAEQQVAVLTEIEQKQNAFFELILNHTRQGYYGDPRHGGNRNMASWKMLRLPFPQIRGRMHYQDGTKG
jgi:gluconate 2-dehydrogenase gamma chain